MLRTIYHTLTQRRFYYHLTGAPRKCNFKLTGNRMQGFNGDLEPNEIINQFENLIYVDIPELSAPLQIDKWFQCGFFDKSKTLVVMFQHLENRASCFQYFVDRGYNFVSLVDLDNLPHRLGLPVLVHSLLLSESLKGTDVSVKCAKEIVRYRRTSPLSSVGAIPSASEPWKRNAACGNVAP